jgi:hypothetical protein
MNLCLQRFIVAHYTKAKVFAAALVIATIKQCVGAQMQKIRRAT